MITATTNIYISTLNIGYSIGKLSKYQCLFLYVIVFNNGAITYTILLVHFLTERDLYDIVTIKQNYTTISKKISFLQELTLFFMFNTKILHEL